LHGHNSSQPPSPHPSPGPVPPPLHPSIALVDRRHALRHDGDQLHRSTDDQRPRSDSQKGTSVDEFGFRLDSYLVSSGVHHHAKHQRQTARPFWHALGPDSQRDILL